MPDEKKLGTTITYLDPDGNNKPVRVLDIPLAPNKAVDLADFVSQGDAEAMAKKLAGNPFFKVEGGPDHSEAREDRQARLFKQEQDVQSAFRRNQERRKPAEPEEPEAPETYNAPSENTLEGGNAPHVRQRGDLPKRK